MVSRFERRYDETGVPVPVDDVLDEVRRIEARPALYPALLNALWSAIACAAFAFLNNGGPVEVGGVFIAAGLGQLLRRAMLHRGYNPFGVTMLAATLACFTYLGLVTGLHAPEASHLRLLEAVAGTELVGAAYRAAVAGHYLWHEFGDSMLFVP